MKHARHEILQDYFENVLVPSQEAKVKEHLLDCDVCTKTLSQFAQIETKLKKQTAIEISEKTKENIFADAKRVLALRREKIQRRADSQEMQKLFFEEWRDNIFPEIKIPALQLCSLSLIITTIVAIENMERGEDYYEPLSTDVSVFTFKDVSQKAEE